MYKKISRQLAAVFLTAIFISIGLHEIRILCRYSLLCGTIVETPEFRSQPVTQEMADFILQQEEPGEFLGVYWLETDFGQQRWPGNYSEETFYSRKQKWQKKEEWQTYVNACRAIWDDLEYFPIPEPEGKANAGVSFVDSWMYERNYGGKRGHEGCDIMAEKNVRGLYPVVSMTDGVVLHKGWLEQGGYRIGITAPGGAYFYYAHLDSYSNLDVGDTVKAGDLLGFMGDTGYGKIEGTNGNFPVHLHLGIYLTDTGEEISVNPYPVLKYLESRKLKCNYSAMRRKSNISCESEPLWLNSYTERET